MTDNAKIFKSGLESYVAHTVKPGIESILRDTAQMLVSIIEGSFTPPWGSKQFPVYTGNLRDATGVGVYVDGKLSSYTPVSVANTTQTMGGRIGIDGAVNLRLALEFGRREYANGIWVVLFSAVPYAYKINTSGSRKGRGKEYFDTLGDALKQEVVTWFMLLTPE